MDTTDPEIVFDDKGVCNHCHDYDRNVNGYPSIGKTVRSVGKDHLFQGRGGGHLMKHSKEMNINAGGVSQKKNWRHTTECPFQKGETVFQKTSLLSAINAI